MPPADIAYTTGIAAGELCSALRNGATGIAIFERSLRGLRRWETRDEFWRHQRLTPWIVTEEEKSELWAPPLTDEESVYFRRYQSMERYDVFHILDGSDVLTEGWPLSFQPAVEAMQAVFAKPQTITFTRHGQTIRARISAGECREIFHIEYHNETDTQKRDRA